MDGLVLVAAGRSERFGGALPKVLVRLRGTPVLVRALKPFRVAVDALAVAIVARAEDVRAVERLVSRAAVVPGGATRAESVRLGVAALPADVETILVHDAARPLAGVVLVRRVLDAARRDGAAAPVLPVTESVHRLEPAAGDGPARLVEALDRSRIVVAQTPQAARADLLRRALAEAEAAGLEPTDEVQALLAAGIPVTAVPGERDNLKITVPEDLAFAEAFVGEEG
jgi:2-C-methyl-D-erythritol 4-phosphate cytidylyltransferase